MAQGYQAQTTVSFEQACVCLRTEGQRQNSDTPPAPGRESGAGGRRYPRPVCGLAGPLPTTAAFLCPCIWMSHRVHRYTPAARARGPDLQTSLSLSAGGVPTQLRRHPAAPTWVLRAESPVCASSGLGRKASLIPSPSLPFICCQRLAGACLGPEAPRPLGKSGELRRQAEAPRASEVGAPGKPRSPQEHGSGTQRQQQRDPREAGLSVPWSEPCLLSPSLLPFGQLGRGPHRGEESPASNGGRKWGQAVGGAGLPLAHSLPHLPDGQP